MIKAARAVLALSLVSPALATPYRPPARVAAAAAPDAPQPVARARQTDLVSLTSHIRRERQPFIETLRDLVAIESGSRDPQGLARIADLIAARLRALGGVVEMVAPPPSIRFDDTPPQIGRAVLARFTGTGTRKILLLAHMDTVYERGMGAQQPFRIDGDRAYGLGIADDKQGVALILHTLAVLRQLNFSDYGTLTVLINGDEEISAPSTRTLITRLGSEHDVVFSCEGTGADDSVRLATSGNGAVILTVKGRASHAGGAPEQGRNALYELAHQILQMRDLSDPANGVRLNWTVASAGTVRNMIPADARATADVRVEHVTDFDVIERRVRARMAKQLIAEARVEAVVERRRPPLEPTSASRALAERARTIYRDYGKTLQVVDEGGGGATDASFAALLARGPVIEGLGLIGFGGHSNNAEYIDMKSIEPRLYLLTRLVLDGAVQRR